MLRAKGGRGYVIIFSSVSSRGAACPIPTIPTKRYVSSAINFILIGASNELGGFESGLVAQFFGPVIAVVSGGIGTVLVVLLVALIWPQMRRLDAISTGA